MRDHIFTIYDDKAKAHLPPWIMHNSDMAIRTFSDCVNSPEHAFHQHPADYTLFIHGSFDNENAAFTLQSHPKSIGNGLEFVNPDEPGPKNETIRDVAPLRSDAKG